MIDINLVKTNSKYYSVKCNLTFNEGSVVTVKIIGLNLVEPTR